LKSLNTSELKSLEQFFQLSQKQLLKAMNQYLKSKYDKVIATKDYVIAVGDIPIALVAHLDTVFAEGVRNIYYDKVKNVMWSPDGLGADDRAGIYSIIQLVRMGFRPTVIFTTDEELGCLGASQVAKDFPIPPANIKYVIELDRRGAEDCVFYDCENQQFIDYVEEFGFVTNFGSFSDICAICPVWKVAGVNLSIGYYNEHTHTEILHVGQMYNTIRRVQKMLQSAASAPEFKYIGASRFTSVAYPTEDDNYGWDPSWGISKEEWLKYVTTPMHKCNQCGTWEYENNLVPTKAENGETVFFCDGCASTHRHLHICANCGEAFLDKTHDFAGEAALCKDCRGKR
jgi:hypothetical protein